MIFSEIMIPHSQKGRLLLVCDEVIRLISARLAIKQEVKDYEKGLWFEKTESEYVVVYGNKINNIAFYLSKKLQPLSNRIPFYNYTTALQSRVREIDTPIRICKTLKDNERGLLLFGAGHTNRLFLSVLKSSNLNLEIFDYEKKYAVKV